jgi:hypothetical protein
MVFKDSISQRIVGRFLGIQRYQKSESIIKESFEKDDGERERERGRVKTEERESRERR